MAIEIDLDAELREHGGRDPENDGRQEFRDHLHRALPRFWRSPLMRSENGVRNDASVKLSSWSPRRAARQAARRAVRASRQAKANPPRARAAMAR